MPSTVQIPAQLLSAPNWIAWKTELSDTQRPTKVPYIPGTSRRASSADASGWLSHNEALRRLVPGSGLGFVFTKSIGITGIDLDDCFEPDGRVTEWAQRILEQFPTYQEKSPSGRGIHIFASGSLSGDGVKIKHAKGPGGIEMYDTGRYFTWTGEAINSLPIQDCQSSITSLYERIRGARTPVPTPTSHVDDESKITAGGRHDFLLSMAARLRTNGLSSSSLLAALRNENTARCSPPKSDSEIEGIVSWFAQKPVGYKFNPSDYPIAVNGAALVPVMEADPVDDAIQSVIATKDAAQMYSDSLAHILARAGSLKQFEAQRLLKAAFPKEFPGTIVGWNKKIQAFRDATRSQRPTVEGDVDLLAFDLNDQGNAERVKAMFGDDMRYCPPFNKWLVWDQKRWTIDDTGAARQLAKQAMRKFSEQAGYDEELSKAAKGTLNNKGITNALIMLESDIPITTVELDSDQWALNCMNGTVDLRTSDIAPHDRSQMITKIIHYDYDPQAQCPLWMRFLYSAMGDEPDADEKTVARAEQLVSFLHMAIGYSITGSTSEKAVFIPLGERGNNGKSTMLNVIRGIVEEYATILNVDTLMVRQESNSTQADLADLRGKRFVQTSETEETQSLSQGKLKNLTAGQDSPIKARRLYENPVEFKGTHHIWLDTNKMPHVKDPDDEATLARLFPIPFTKKIENPDQEFSIKLQAEAPGILAWMIAGAKLWYENKLGRPQEILEARNEWKTSQQDADMEHVEVWLEKMEREYTPSSSQRPYFVCSTSDILQGALGVRAENLSKIRGEQIRLGRMLKRLGWIPDGQRGMSKVRIYRKA